jgi:DNA repair protein RadC
MEVVMPTHPKKLVMKWVVDKTKDISGIELADPKQAAKHGFGVIGEEFNEKFFIIAYSCRKEYIGEQVVTQGDHTSTQVNPVGIITAILMAGAQKVIVMHNHPSGDPTPSQEDRAITTVLAAILQYFKIDLMDHIVLGDDGEFFSILFNRRFNFNDPWDNEEPVT